MTTRELRLSRETLRRLDERGRTRAVADDSCVLSCYDMTCGPNCDPPLPSLETTAR
jgi:hypothetical protein